MKLKAKTVASASAANRQSTNPTIHSSTCPLLPQPVLRSALDGGGTEIALAAFAMLEKLDSGRRLPPPSISKIFHLYCIDDLSAEQIAKQCRCSKAAVIRRLKFIRKQTGLSPVLLRKQTDFPTAF